MPLIVLVANAMDGFAYGCLLVVSAHNHSYIFAGTGIFFVLSVQQIREKHPAHQKAGKQCDADHYPPYIYSRQKAGNLLYPPKAEDGGYR